MQQSLYPPDWKRRASECLERAGFRCEVCGIPHGTMRVGKHHHNLYFVHLHAAHVNHDVENPQAELWALCPTCHMRYDWRSQQQAQNNRKFGRTGYQVISAERLVAVAHSAGLNIAQEDGRYHWQVAHMHGCASDMLEALGSALHFLVMEVTLS